MNFMQLIKNLNNHSKKFEARCLPLHYSALHNEIQKNIQTIEIKVHFEVEFHEMERREA